MRRDKLTIYRAEDGWRWRYTSSNGRVLADGGQAYSRQVDARRGAERVTGCAAAATILSARLAQHREEWAAWLESWIGAVGSQPPTVEAVVDWLRADRLPFGRSAVEPEPEA